MVGICIVVFAAFLWFFQGRRTNVSGVRLRSFSKEDSLPVRGLLVLFVVVGHCDTAHPGNMFLRMLHLSLPAVAAFFFLSGYGLYRGYVNNGCRLRHGQLLSSIVKLLVPLLVVISVWLLCKLVISGVFTMGWDVFFPNMCGETFVLHAWYVYALLLFYIFFFLSFGSLGGAPAFILVSFLMLSYYVVVRFGAQWGRYWSDMSFCFVVGLLFACFERHVIAVVNRFGGKFFICLAFVFLVLGLVQRCPGGVVWVCVKYALLSFAFGILMLELPRVSFGRSLGIVSFEIYLLHGLPEAYLKEQIESPMLYTVSVLVITGALAFVFHPVNARLVRFLQHVIVYGRVMEKKV